MPNITFSQKNKQLFITLLIACNLASIALYLFVNLLLFDIHFFKETAIQTLPELSLAASCFAIAVSFTMILVDSIDTFARKKIKLRVPAPARQFLPAIILLVIMLAACNGQTFVGKGIKKDFNTGIVSSYTNMEPEKVMLVMNNEVLNHTDIPLGEKFLLVNDNIRGMIVKEGKVSIGCSLTIADQQGIALLQEKDLFAGNDLFNEKEATMLKCTVTTGAPMKWEEKYNVTVIFWDKYGNGKIENNFTIRCIDIP